MCLDCGCHDWNNSHGDSRHIVSQEIIDAIAANGGKLTLRQVAADIYDGLWAMIGQDEAE